MAASLTSREDLLTLDEICAIMDRSRPTVVRYFKTGVIPASKIGGIWYVRRDAFESLFAALEIEGDPS